MSTSVPRTAPVGSLADAYVPPTGRGAAVSARWRWAMLVVLALGLVVRAWDVWRPVDGYRESWREADMAAVARNFAREGMDVRYPRIDWRGTGPGFAEMEFPAAPWLSAVAYHAVGVHEQIGRLLSLAFAAGALAIFALLAWRLLAPPGALVATAFFACSPLPVRLATALQPEPLMLLCYLAGLYAFVRWLDGSGDRYLWIAAVATGGAVLAKATAAHIGVAYLILLVQRRRLTWLRDWRLWAFGAIALVPGALWYRHAHALYLQYGNSLGVSNEYHWFGFDLLRRSVLEGLVGIELGFVWGYAGALLAAIGLVAAWRQRAVAVAAAWLVALALYYMIALRTTSRDWATYYHVVSAAPAALLVGAGFEVMRRAGARGRSLVLPLAALVVAAGCGALAVRRAIGAGWGSPWTLLGAAIAVISTLVVVRLLENTSAIESDGGPRGTIGGWGLAVAAMALGAGVIARDRLPNTESPTLSSAQAFAPLMPAPGLLLASGGPCVGPTGRPVAYNASYFFYWLDRKGFNVCEGEQSLAAVRGYEERGARYFVAERVSMATKPGFEAEMRGAYPVLAQTDAAVLFDLRPALGTGQQR